MNPLTSSDRQLLRILPLLRITRTWFGRRLTALYEDSLLAGRLKAPIPLNEKHCLPEGKRIVRALLDSPREIPWTGVRSASAAEPTGVPGLGANWRFRVDAGDVRADFQVRPEDAGNVLWALKRLLPCELTPLKGVWHHLSVGKVTFISLLFGLPALLGGILGWSAEGPLFGLIGAAAAAVHVAFLSGLIVGAFWFQKWRSNRPGRRHTKDLSGKRPFRSRALGWVLKIGSLAWFGLLVGGFIPLPEGDMGWRLSFLLGLVPVAGMYLGYRLSLVEPREADENASPRPILYLRAFDDDHKTNLQPPSQWNLFMGVSPQVQGRAGGWRFLQGGWTRLVRLFFNAAVDTSEEQLARFFGKIGPFVAIGRPGEALPSPGAQRIYVGDGEWRQAVLDRLCRCQAVVLQPAMTRGIWWEVEQTLRRVEPFRILMCLVNFRDRPDDWEKFRLRIEPALPGPLPRSVPFLEEFSFLYFERDWRPVLQRLSYRSPLLWPVLGDATDLDYTLTPFVQGMHGGEREPPRPPVKRPVQAALARGLMVAAQFLLGAVLTLPLIILTAEGAGSREREVHQGKAVAYTISVPRNWHKLPPEEASEGTDLHCRSLFVNGETVAELRVFAGPLPEDVSGLPAALLATLKTQDGGTVVEQDETVTVHGIDWKHYCFVLPAARTRVYLRVYSGKQATVVVRVDATAWAEVLGLLPVIPEVLDSVDLPPAHEPDEVVELLERLGNLPGIGSRRASAESSPAAREPVVTVYRGRALGYSISLKDPWKEDAPVRTEDTAFTRAGTWGHIGFYADKPWDLMNFAEECRAQAETSDARAVIKSSRHVEVNGRSWREAVIEVPKRGETHIFRAHCGTKTGVLAYGFAATKDHEVLEEIGQALDTVVLPDDT